MKTTTQRLKTYSKLYLKTNNNVFSRKVIADKVQ